LASPSRRRATGAGFSLSIFVDHKCTSIDHCRLRFSCRLGAGEQTEIGHQARFGGSESIMLNIKKKLQNPFLLMVQGFIGGAIFLYATTPLEADIKQQLQPGPSAEAKMSQA
jgi:hypothetical protein